MEGTRNIICFIGVVEQGFPGYDIGISSNVTRYSYSIA